MISTSYVVYKRTQCLASLQPGLGVRHRETMKPTTTLRKFNDKYGSLVSRSLVELFLSPFASVLRHEFYHSQMFGVITLRMPVGRK